jgi:hypothetical protein
MKKSLGWLMVTALFLYANQGAELFQKKCASCHNDYIPQSRLNKNYKEHNRPLKLKAPTLTELSFRLKDQIGDRTSDAESQTFEIEAFLEQFLKNPAANPHTILPAHVRELFQVMPPVEVSESEVEALAAYMYAYAEKMMVAHGVKRYSYEAAKKKAQAEGKMILIEGYIPFCRGCVWMDRNVMVEPEVKALLRRSFLLVKKNLLVETLPLGMKRLGTPSFYFISSDGKQVIDRVSGMGTVEEFIDLLKHIQTKERSAAKKI